VESTAHKRFGANRTVSDHLTVFEPIVGERVT
jgi:hypothetical protein